MPVLPSYRKQSVDLQSKSIEWFLYEGNTGAPQKFGMTFEDQKELLSTYQGSSVTLVKFTNGEFHKYSVNYNCTCIQMADVELKSTYVKAQTLVHFNFVLS